MSAKQACKGEGDAHRPESMSWEDFLAWLESMRRRGAAKPPSRDGYDKPQPKRRRRKSGKCSGGQPGHNGRTLERIAEPDHVIEHEPLACTGCGSAITAAPVVGIEARQVFDLPPQRLEVTVYRAAIRCCPRCAAR